MISRDELKTFLDSQSTDSKIYIGCDSERVLINGKWFADYTTVVVIHINNNNGCKIFGETVREPDYEVRNDRPRFRLMNEVYKISQLYLDFQDLFENREVEIHLDVNPDQKHGSSCVVSEAVGYVRGVCNIDPKVKPNSFAASTAADRLKF